MGIFLPSAQSFLEFRVSVCCGFQFSSFSRQMSHSCWHLELQLRQLSVNEFNRIHLACRPPVVYFMLCASYIFLAETPVQNGFQHSFFSVHVEEELWGLSVCIIVFLFPYIETRWGRDFPHPSRPVPGAHTASYTMGVGSLSRG